MTELKYEFEEYRVEKRPMGYVVTDCDDMFALGLKHKENAELVAKVLNDDNNGVSDAVEQKHGHWERIGYLDQCCSLCGNTPECETGETPPMYDYCPYCGAKMDEVTENV